MEIIEWYDSAEKYLLAKEMLADLPEWFGILERCDSCFRASTVSRKFIKLVKKLVQDNNKKKQYRQMKSLKKSE